MPFPPVRVKAYVSTRLLATTCGETCLTNKKPVLHGTLPSPGSTPTYR